MSRFHLALAIAVVAAIAGSSVAGAQNPERYQQIQIRWPGPQDLEVLHAIPDLEVMRVQPDQWIQYLSRPSYTKRLADAGLDPQIIWDDLQAHYVSQTAAAGWGSLYTYSECLAVLDSLHTAYPAITTAKFSIGNSLEGRPIWCLKVSDNPGVDEDEPEVLLDAEHHAREPITVSVVIDFIRFLGSQYGTDAEATFLVDNREIYIVPMVNPDGYLYNEATNPGGGGMWRKNRRDNPGTCEGVDNNRNYSYHWGGGGSSGNPCDETYRGPSPFSEPETQVMRDFISSRHFVTQNSYHSNASMVLFPWGWTATLPPEMPTWTMLAQQMSHDNGYVYGPAYTTIYPADGVMFDWSYGDTLSKPKVYSFTSEIGGSGFWPTEGEIPGLIAENLSSNIYLALEAGPFVTTSTTSVTGGDGNGRLDPGESAGVVLTLRNAGLSAASGTNVTITSSDPYVQILDATASLGSIAPQGTASTSGDPFEVVVDPATPQGHRFTANVLLSWAGGASNESAALVVGAAPVLYADDFEHGNNGWSQDPSHTASTGAWVLIDPNATSRQPGDDATPAPGVIAWITAQNTSDGTDDVDGGVSAMRSPVWDLSGHTHVRLALNWFHGQRDAGGDAADLFKLSLSNNGGSTWPVNLVSLGDATHTATWTVGEWNLEDLLPLTNQMRLRVQAADGTASGDIIEGGIDDVLITDAGDGNQPPPAPVMVSPADGATVPTPTPTLVVDAATDPEGSPLTYSFRVYGDALMTNLAASADGIVVGPLDTASWRVSPPLPAGVTYWWRVFASDGSLRGSFSTARSFTVDAAASVAGGSGGGAPVLQAVSPNPFNGRTAVRFTIGEAGRVRADIFDASGRRVRSLFRGVLPSGFQSLTWDGQDESGRAVPAGLYFMIVETAKGRQNIKLTLVR